MTNKPLWIVAWVVAAAPQIAHAGRAAWCKTNGDADSSELKEMQSSDVGEALGAIVKASCTSTKEIDAKRGEVDAARAAWGKKLGMTEADWADAPAFVESDHSFKTEFSGKGLAQLTPVDQFKLIHEGEGGVDALYVADALDAKLTETGRVALLVWCAKNDSVTRNDGDVVKWAACQGDIDKLDLAKMATELRGDTAHDGAAKMWIRVHAYELANELKDIATKKAALIKKDDEYGKVFDAAKKARDEWQKTFASNTKLLDLVQSTDSGVWFHSRKLLEGCEAKTAEALATAVATVPAKAFTAMHDDREDPHSGFAGKAGPMLAGTPLVHMAAIAYVECQPKSAIGDFLGEFIQNVPGWRGPRSAAIGAISATQFKFDDTQFKGLEYPDLQNRPYRREGGASGSAGGIVKSVKPAGADLDVALEKTTRTVEMCVKQHRGNTARIYWGSGRVEWDMICDQSKPTQIDTTWSNFKVDKAFGAQLKPGVVFSATYGSEHAAVLATWPNKTAKLPTSVLGATIK